MEQVKLQKCEKKIVFISALLYGSQIGNHPRHIGCIDPNCDVLEVARGELTSIRVLNGCEVRIESSVKRVTVWHQKAYQTVIPSEGIFTLHRTT